MKKGEELFRKRLSTKLNLIFSHGKKSEGVIRDEVINKLIKVENDGFDGFDGFGIYEIIYDKSFPVKLMRIHQDYKLKKTNENYIIELNDKIERYMNFNQIINFSVDDYRNYQLKILLNN